MTSTFTSNIGLELPARGDLSGVWDTPENANAALLDLVIGGTTTITLNNSNVVLTAAQYQCRRIVFTGTLNATCIITFPTGFRKAYEIENLCTNNDLYAVVLTTALVGSEYVAAPPGEVVEVANSSVDMRYKNFGRIGEYWDYAGSATPKWLAGCGVYGVSALPLWLNCDGSAFSSTTYPILANVLGGTTLPDARGRTRAALNQGTGRLTSAGGGVDGDTKLAAGGTDGVTLGSSQIPAITAGNASVSFLSTVTTLVRNPSGAILTFQANHGTRDLAPNGGQSNVQPSISGTININSNNTSGAVHTNTQPTFIGGLTLIRAK